MDFNNERPIYLQIAGSISDKILRGELQGEQRIASVREYGAEIGVNPNTVMRTYEKLTSDGIIYNRRGIGYFVSPDARDRILEAERLQFLENELPALARRIALLGIALEEIIDKLKTK